jgi:transcriptional regulator with GAF, ATPase, and Fis domain
MIRIQCTILSPELSLRQVLHSTLQEAGYVAYVPPRQEQRDTLVLPPSGLVIEHVHRALHIYPSQPTRKQRASAAVVPYPPLDLHELITTVNRRAMELRRTSQQAAHRHQRQPTAIIYAPGSPMVDVLQLVQIFGPLDDTVLVTGETGTGKELIVRALHEASPRRDKPLLMVNCAALPELLLESELFGHQKGSFTGAVHTKPGMLEIAHGGTAVLDEINSMPVAVQAKLLRFLQHGEIRRVGDNHTNHVDVRILATTNQPLPELIAERKFRSDLYYRLAAFTIEVPPLRARPMDIPPLVEHFCQGRLGNNVIDLNFKHDWPGNVRELENYVRRALVMLGRNSKLKAVAND